MITYKHKRVLTVAEIWYAGDAEPGSADLVQYRYFPELLAEGSEFTTIWIDLNRSESQLLSEMSKGTRYDVRKAAECDLSYEFWHADSASQVGNFIKFMDAANAAKGLQPIDRAHLWNYASCGVLDLSRVSDRDCNPLAWHAYYRDPSHARQLHSASVFRLRPESQYRTFIGRANRWGCWEDMKRFQREGIQIFDFGGWYAGAEDKDLLAINFFKEGFGGRIVKTYNYTQAKTALGRLYLLAGRLRRRNFPPRDPMKAVGEP